MAWRLALWLLAAAACTEAHSYRATTYANHNLQCRVDDPLSCSQAKHEVCVFTNGQYRCECPNGVNRLPDGRCLLVNECARPSTNGCHRDADCIDLHEGYTCRCKSGFADVSEDKENKPGRICQRTNNECSAKSTYGVDCDPNAACVDTPDGFQCVCQPGYADISATVSKNPGRKCVEMLNECAIHEDDCSNNADCFDRPDGYECKCRPGFVDASPDVAHYPGRVCNKPKAPEHYGQQSRHPQCGAGIGNCGANEECRYNVKGELVCQCQRGSVQQSDGKCKVFSFCERQNECDPSAICSNTYDGYKCQCKSGYRDCSPEPLRLPGRKCQKLVNECIDQNDCSPYATCEDTPESYLCKCNEGYNDVSSRYGLAPGRKCSKVAKECSDPNLNSCDSNADCVQLPDGYTCKCFTGYADVSSNANLPPGRVCTLSTACPTQATDLVFLIDGSGSIGSYIFQNEVLRFLSEFTELFDIGADKTRVSIVQYSDQIRHEFGLGDYHDSQSLHNAIKGISYLTGLTRTGAAIEHVANEAFSERRGARPRNSGVSRIGIVITDGRSQDNVTIPAENARRLNIQLFAVGVTNHVLDQELEEIAGSKDRTFHVNGFEDLNTRLRSAIQKVACPQAPERQPTGDGPCDPNNHNGCDRAKNQICKLVNGKPTCQCPEGFDIHPVTQVCGGDICNPEISTSCPDPEICEKTPFGNWRCTCPADLGWRDKVTGVCKIGTKPDTSESNDQCNPLSDTCGPYAKCIRGPGGEFSCQCREGLVLNAKSGKCQAPGTCDPSIPDSCEPRKREKCLPDSNGLFTCQCPRNYRRNPVTEICLIDECAAGTDDCHQNAKCTDTDESFICTCNHGYLDKSPDQRWKPGRVCVPQRNECIEGGHNCSINADCIDLSDGFLCRCKDNFVDVSPNIHLFGGVECKPLVDECARKELNTCHEHAICIDTRDSYKCECQDGYVDHDELRNPGRDCRKVNQICEGNLHDCDKNARCIERGTNDYECVCNAGFLDKSPLPHRPGRRCLERVCLDDTKHNCHEAAICQEVDGPEKFTCKCRDGYYDDMPNNPGRMCNPLIYECLDRSLNDCDPVATCVDHERGYTCTCPVNTKDISPDKEKPGRNCFPLVDECRLPHLNNCSRFATCINKEDGYECKCKPEYHDQDPSKPGTNCKFIINECQSENLNDCDKHATCTDTLEGYECKCNAPYKDELPSNPGRFCRYNECLDKSTNDCDENADCIDTEDGYVCQCKTGFFDESTDPTQTGRTCIGLVIDRPPEAEKTTLSPNLVPCGNTHCRIDLHEVCIGSEKCGCRPGESRASNDDKCIPVQDVEIVVRVEEFDGEPVHYTSDFGKPGSRQHIEVVESAKKGIGEILKHTDIAPRYVTTDVKYVTNPKVENSSWDTGLLIDSVVHVSGNEDVDKCKIFQDFAQEVISRGGRIDRLKAADDFTSLDPCKKEDQISGIPCGSTVCKEELGEECIAGKVCGCPKDMKRKDSNSVCRIVESWNIPIYVIRDGSKPIEYSTEMANPLSEITKKLVSRFESGIVQSYEKTPLKKSFVAVEVNDIENPENRKANWDTGILYNFTTHFIKGAVEQPRTVYEELFEYIAHRNNFEVGKSKLFISPDQLNPFSKCYRADCHPAAICKENAHGYSCECPDGFRDLNPSKPGRQCLSYRGVNECEKQELNECSPNARCIDLDYLYKCECNSPYVDASEPGAVPGSVCSINHCLDVNYCPLNSTCKVVNEEPKCLCTPGFVDIRDSPVLSEAGLGETICLRSTDVNECLLGLHDCSAVADCIDKKNGYECKCRDGYEDGNPANPGHVCAAPQCGHCSGHGDCIHEALSSNITCACFEGYTGQFCQVAPSKLPLILMLLLALLFLLLTLLCCLYLCARCRCFGARGMSEGSGSGREILGSDYYTIPRAKLKNNYGDEMMGHDNAGALGAYLDDGGSISSDGSLEEIERRVTTDVTTREVRTTTVRDEHGNVISQSQMVSHGASGIPLETEVEQFAVTSSDHFRHGAAGSSSAAAYDSDASSDDGHAVFDRTTRATESHDFEPGMDPRTGVERRRNEFVTTTKAEEVNYFN